MSWINLLLIKIFAAQDNLDVTKADKVATRYFEEKMCGTNFKPISLKSSSLQLIKIKVKVSPSLI